jgi:hypothetical protein
LKEERENGISARKAVLINHQKKLVMQLVERSSTCKAFCRKAIRRGENMSFVPPPYSDMLNTLDLVMQKQATTLAGDLKMTQDQADKLAHSIEADIKALDAVQKQLIKDALKPLSVNDISHQHWTIEGMRLLSNYVDELEKKVGGDAASSIYASGLLNLENYFVFVFLRESLFEVVRESLKITHNRSALFKACQFLLKDDIRSVRNAISHATWTVDPSTKALKYWDWEKRTEYSMDEARWLFLRNLAYTVSYVVIKNL